MNVEGEVKRLMDEAKQLESEGKFVEALERLEEVFFLKEDNAEILEYYKNVFSEQFNLLIKDKKYEICIDFVKKIRVHLSKKDSFIRSVYSIWGTDLLCQDQYFESLEKLWKGHKNVLSIIHIFNRTGLRNFSNKRIKDLNQKIFDLILEESFFGSAVKKDYENNKIYQNIYSKSLEIIDSLFVDEVTISNLTVAHYTKKNVAEKIFFEESPLRLNSVVKANDPSEGKILLYYLGLKEESINDDSQAFISCFSFNENNLNQFRLYGKENGKEGTGISFIISNELFNPINTFSPDELYSALPLYRCIYIDPKTEQVVSLGHKDAINFYQKNPDIYKNNKEEKEKLKAEIDNYLSSINELKDKVEGELAELKTLIQDAIQQGAKEEIIAELLKNLRYLVKHYAFKEEQECRLIRVELLKNNPEIKYDNGMMYIDYMTLDENSVEKLIFGPLAEDHLMFRDRLKLKGIDIPCEKSDLPYFS